MSRTGIRIAASAAALPLLFACDPGAQAGPATVASDSADIRIIYSDPASSGATCTIGEEPAVVIGDDDSDENQWFSSVRDAARLSDGSIAAVDQAWGEIRIYDSAGEHLHTMGRHGEGPGEFQDPYQIWVGAGDTIWVGDYSPWRYNLFAPDGAFVRVVGLAPMFINPSRAGGVLDNGYSVNSTVTWFRKSDYSVADSMVVEGHGPDGQLVDTLASIPHGSWGQDDNEALRTYWLPRLFDARAVVDAGGSTVALGHGLNAEVRVLDDEFDLRLIVRWTEPDREVTGGDVEAWRADYTREYERPTSSPMAEAYDANLSDDRPVADLFPAISGVMVGRDDRIWVRQYDRPGEDRGWLAFDPDGEFRCHMAPPPGSILEFGSDYVLLRHESDLGVQTVRLHGMELPQV